MLLSVCDAGKKKKKEKIHKTSCAKYVELTCLSETFQLIDRAKRSQLESITSALRRWTATSTAAGAPLTGAANPEKVISSANRGVR